MRHRLDDYNGKESRHRGGSQGAQNGKFPKSQKS